MGEHERIRRVRRIEPRLEEEIRSSERAIAPRELCDRVDESWRIVRPAIWNLVDQHRAEFDSQRRLRPHPDEEEEE